MIRGEKMIRGIGIDLTELGRIQRVVKRQPGFIDRVLTAAEKSQYNKFAGQRAIEYLGGRWSLKESFGKAMHTGIGAAVGFQDLEILDNGDGASVVTRSPFHGNVQVSVSHTAELVMTEVILEEDAEK